MKKHQRDVIVWLKRAGAIDVELVPRRTHPRICFTWNGERMECLISGTPGNPASCTNAVIRSLRRRLGLTNNPLLEKFHDR